MSEYLQLKLKRRHRYIAKGESGGKWFSSQVIVVHVSSSSLSSSRGAESVQCAALAEAPCQVGPSGGLWKHIHVRNKEEEMKG